MTGEQEAEKRLKEALIHTAPNDLQGVLSHCEKQEREVALLPERHGKKRVWGLIAACLALVLAGGAGWFYQQSYAVASIVSLDVNPSIELTVNQKEQVLSCTPLNQEAEAVLADIDGGLDLKGTKLDVAVNAVVGSLVRHGYLDRISSAILISVEDNDAERAARLRQELTTTVDGWLQDQESNASVLSQTLTLDAQLDRQAKKTGISTGKAALVQSVLAVNGSLDFDALAALSVEELKDLMEAGAPAMPIGRSAAAMLAEEYAGTLELDSVYAEVDPELDEVPAHYEVTLCHPTWGEQEYRIDAYTGAVLSGQASLLDSLNASTLITPERAQTAALEHQAAQYPELAQYNVLDLRAHLDHPKKGSQYEVEFFCGGYEFEYEVDAYTGAVLDWDTNYKGTPVRTETFNGTEAVSSGDIGEAAAKAAALAHAGVRDSDAFDWDVDRDCEDGRLEYEIEFKAGGMEYEYTIDGSTGVILEHELDRDD